jgi:hypothetical protein
MSAQIKQDTTYESLALHVDIAAVMDACPVLPYPPTPLQDQMRVAYSLARLEAAVEAMLDAAERAEPSVRAGFMPEGLL